MPRMAEGELTKTVARREKIKRLDCDISNGDGTARVQTTPHNEDE